MRLGFTTLVLYMLGTLLAWMGCFVCVYVLAALACARDLDAYAPGGVPLVNVLTIATFVATAALTIAISWHAGKSLRSTSTPPPDEKRGVYARFVPFVALAGGVLALIALAWLALPLLLLPLGC
jgi:hypothetical protein